MASRSAIVNCGASNRLRELDFSSSIASSTTANGGAQSFFWACPNLLTSRKSLMCGDLSSVAVVDMHPTS